MPDAALEASVEASDLDLGGYRLRTTSPALVRVEFAFSEGDAELDDEADERFDLTLRTQRPQTDAVSVELCAKSRSTGNPTFDVAFRIGIRVETADDDMTLDLDSILRQVAARIGPVILYPYVRELLGSLSQRSPGPSVILPVMNVGLAFDPKEIELEGASAGSDDE